VYLNYATPGGQSSYETDPAQLPALLRQVAADLADPTVTYLLGGHYYDRTNHPRYRHFPAVFALRQDEVSNLEVGPDFMAFDTESVRYPERGEAHYPGPWADRFRATVPFAQLYQLCRQVLTPAEQAAEEISYGPETIIYYNAGVHKNYSTPADMNQAYAAPPSGAHPLEAVLMAVATGLADPANHYLVNTTYFDSPNGPVLLGRCTCTRTPCGTWPSKPTHSPVRYYFLPTTGTGHRCAWALPMCGRWSAATRHKSIGREAEETGGILYDAPEVLSTYTQSGRPV